MPTEKRNIADELAYMAEHPDMFSKEKMAAAMKKAVTKMRSDTEGLANIRAVLVEAAGQVARLEDQRASAIILKGEGTGDE